MPAASLLRHDAPFRRLGSRTKGEGVTEQTDAVEEAEEVAPATEGSTEDATAELVEDSTEDATEDPAEEPTEETAEDATAEPAEDAPAQPAPQPHPDPVSPWPFAAYVTLWLAFAGWVVWQFSQVPGGEAVFEASAYPISMLGGLILAIAGPVLTVAVWIASWGAPGRTKVEVLSSAAIKGAIATLAGVALWWLALVIVDQVRMGRVL